MKAPPPMPEDSGSTRPSIACTAIAASTAEPPRFRISAPASAASGCAAATRKRCATPASRASAAKTRANAAMAARARTLLDAVEVQLLDDFQGGILVHALHPALHRRHVPERVARPAGVGAIEPPVGPFGVHLERAELAGR